MRVALWIDSISGTTTRPAPHQTIRLADDRIQYWPAKTMRIRPVQGLLASCPALPRGLRWAWGIGRLGEPFDVARPLLLILALTILPGEDGPPKFPRTPPTEPSAAVATFRTLHGF